MELLEGEALRRRILESYSKDPRGWSFVVSPSLNSGFFDAMVSGPDRAWLLKIDSIFKPSPTVLGSQVEADSRLKSESPFPYGYRRFSPEMILQLLGGERLTLDAKMLRGLVSALRSEPVVPEAGRSYAEGPFVLAKPGKLDLFRSQREVDARLASEMRRLMRNRYPAYG
jgi:hypothetical protein